MRVRGLLSGVLAVFAFGRAVELLGAAVHGELRNVLGLGER